MKDLFIIFGHPDTEEKISDMLNVVSQVKKTGKEILVTANCEVPDVIQNEIDYCIVDYNNPSIEISDYVDREGRGLYDPYYTGFGTGYINKFPNSDNNVNIVLRAHPYHCAALILIGNGIRFAFNNNYDFFYVLECDVELDDRDLNVFEETKIRLLEEDKDGYVLLYDNSHLPFEDCLGFCGLSAEFLIGNTKFFYENIKWVNSKEEYLKNCWKLFDDVRKTSNITWIHYITIESYLYENLRYFINDRFLKETTLESSKDVKCTLFPNSIFQTKSYNAISVDETAMLVVDSNLKNEVAVYMTNLELSDVRYRYEFFEMEVGYEGSSSILMEEVVELFPSRVEGVDIPNYLEGTKVPFNRDYTLQYFKKLPTKFDKLYSLNIYNETNLNSKLIFSKTFTKKDLIGYVDRHFPMFYDENK